MCSPKKLEFSGETPSLTGKDVSRRKVCRVTLARLAEDKPLLLNVFAEIQRVVPDDFDEVADEI